MDSATVCAIFVDTIRYDYISVRSKADEFSSRHDTLLIPRPPQWFIAFCRRHMAFPGISKASGQAPEATYYGSCNFYTVKKFSCYNFGDLNP